MRRLIGIATLIGLSMMSAACENPADGKARAAVSSASAEATAKPAGSETLAISPATSSIGFIGSKVTGSHTGSFQGFSGTINLVADKVENSQVAVEIDMATVASDDDRLTGHLKSPDFFDVAKFPKATFVTTEIKPGASGGATHTVTGNLELHGVKKSITFPATIAVDTGAATLNTEFAINRKEFGILYPGKSDDLIRDEVVIRLAINAPRARS
ncbi:MAG TPA: YceI family protein [Blastocatellia bacterium]|nr:YceI family protein [Blastocatellia bacterium]